MERSKITIQASINEDREKVWDYYTNPAHIIHWNFADPSWHCPAASNDLQLGGKYFARMEARDGSFGFDFEAIYKEIKIGEGFTYEFGDRLAEINIKEENGKTIVTITFDPELENPIDLQRDGWQAILNNFKTYTESH